MSVADDDSREKTPGLNSDADPVIENGTGTAATDAVAALNQQFGEMMKKFETFSNQVVARLDGQQEAINEVKAGAVGGRTESPINKALKDLKPAKFLKDNVEAWMSLMEKYFRHQNIGREDDRYLIALTVLPEDVLEMAQTEADPLSATAYSDLLALLRRVYQKTNRQKVRMLRQLPCEPEMKPSEILERSLKL